MEKFEKAARFKLRFNTTRGMVGVEELWDMPLKAKTGDFDLNTVAIDCYADIKKNETLDFVGSNYKTAKDAKEAELAELRMELVKYIISVKQEEMKEKVSEKATAEHNAKIDELIAEKQAEALKGKTIEELIALKK